MKYEVPNLARCCFCMPLRRGILTFGFINVLFSAFMVGMYSFQINTDHDYLNLVYHGVISPIASEICVALYCLEIIASIVLIYGAFKKIVLYLKIFYYYAISTVAATLIIEIIEFSRIRYFPMIFEMAVFTFAGICIQLYVVLLVRSLLIKLERASTHHFENQLQQIVVGERIIDNDVASFDTLPADKEIDLKEYN